MRKAKKLNKNDRNEIEILIIKGYSLRNIAEVLNRSPNSISYEIKINGGKDRYKAKNAHIYARTRKKNAKFQWKKIEEDIELKEYIIAKLKDRWNPDEISGRMRKDKEVFYASKNSIYRWLYSERGQRYCKYLYSKRYYLKKYIKKTKREMIPDRISILKRSKGAENRTRYGHVELDTIVGKKGTKGGLSVGYERKSRLIKVEKVKSMSSFEHLIAHRKIVNKLKAKSATFDNGIENREHMNIGIPTFFCAPYHSWEKGGVENANKMIRTFFPKKTDFSLISQEEVNRIVSIINNKPRKILGYATALEVAMKAGIINKEK